MSSGDTKSCLERTLSWGSRPTAASGGGHRVRPSMLQMAASPFAPANADEELRAAALDELNRSHTQPVFDGLRGIAILLVVVGSGPADTVKRSNSPGLMTPPCQVIVSTISDTVPSSVLIV